MYENLNDLYKTAISLKSGINDNISFLHHPQSSISILIHLEAIIDILKQELEWEKNESTCNA
jgi:hypothetical protein